MKREIQRTLEPTRRLSASYAFEQANAAYDAGEYSKALMLFEQARSSGLETEVVYNNRGAALDALGRCEDAARSYRYAIHLAPEYELAWHNLGNCFYSRSLYREAAECYERASSLDKSRWQNIYGLASSHIRLGRKRRGRAMSARLVSCAEDNLDALLAAAELYIDLDNPAEAIALSERCLRIQPGSSKAMTIIGSAYHEEGEYLNAIEAFEAALKSTPDDKGLLDNLGYTYFCSGQLARALECFDKAIEIDPTYKPAWYNKGYSLHGADRLSQAVECYTRAIEIDADDRVLWNNLGNALYNLGKFSESIPKFVEAIRVDPGYEIAWNNIGNALEKVGLWERAIHFHDRALELRPGFDYALYAKGVCKSMTGHSEEGFDLITASLEMNPDYDEAWKALSKVAQDLGRSDEAIEAIDESLSVNPGFGDGWAEKGDLLSAMGDLEGANRAYVNALRSLPMRSMESQNEITSIMTRVKVLNRLGMYQEALSVLEDAVLMGIRDPSVLRRLLDVRCILDEFLLPEEVGAAIWSVNDASVQTALCHYLIRGGRLGAAREVMTRLEMMDVPHNDRILLSARLLDAEGDSEDAISLLSHEGELSPAMHKLLGEIAERSGKLQLAVKSYSDALDAIPSDYVTAVSLARVSLLLKDHDSAIDASLVASGIDGDEPEPYRIRAEAYAALGRTGNAEIAMAEAESRTLSDSGSEACGRGGPSR